MSKEINEEREREREPAGQNIFTIMSFLYYLSAFRVAERSKDNCMDSKNLAICWWPTLLRYEFGDLCKFEAMRPHLEEIVQTMIDQFSFLFCDGEAVTRV